MLIIFKDAFLTILISMTLARIKERSKLSWYQLILIIILVLIGIEL